MRISLVFLLLFCCSAACWAQQDRLNAYKNQLGIHAGTSTGNHWNLEFSNFYEPETRNQVPLEICYKRALKNSYFLRLGTGVWYQESQTNREESIPQATSSNVARNAFIYSLNFGIEKQIRIAPKLALALGAELVPRYTRVNTHLVEGTPDTMLNRVNIRSKHSFYTMILSPFVELQYALSKRFMLVAHSNMRASYSYYKVKSVYTYDQNSNEDANAAHQFHLQSNPVAHVALYFGF
ncbi:MAG: hypothetical protein EAZ57_04245 [Cytophagales bacterium]|nr:MAG: hypothetical protein EAZ67_05265 [Cytophagales bacterium]TAF61209.1 MAG: hypothetical protein EAZ57_04245 [Cytophagales bacterium]